MARKSNSAPSKSTSTTKATSTTRATGATGANVKSELGISDLRLRFNFLEQENANLIKQIETNKTKLNDLNDSIQAIGLEIVEKSAPLRQKAMELDQKIHDTFEQILTARKLGKKTKKDVESVYYHLQADGIISSRQLPISEDSPKFPDFADSEDWQEDDQKSEHLLEDIPKLDRDEQKKIRQVFLRLADNFHPDKVTDQVEKEYRTEVMKEINLAYQNGDLAKLLAIEKQKELGVEIDRDSADDLTRQCLRVEAENDFLKNQLEDLKRKLKLTRKSEPGELTAVFKKMAKLGGDPIAEALSGIEAEIAGVEKLYKFITDFRDRRITVKEFLKGPTALMSQRQISEEELMLEFLSHFV